MTFLWLLFIWATETHASWSEAYEFDLWGVHENLSRDALGDPYQHSDLLTRAESRIRYKNSSFRFSVDTQLRGLKSWASYKNEQQRSLLASSIPAPRRGFRLRSELWSDRNTEWQMSFERLSFGWKSKSFSVSAGRQPFSLGLMKLVPIWNRFVINLPLPGIFFQFPARDGVIFRTQYEFWNLQAFAVIEKENERSAYLLENSITWDSLELKLLFGNWENSLSWGGAASIEIFDGTLRAEYLHSGINSNDSESIEQGGVGFETALNSDFSILFETLSLSTGENDINNYDNRELTRFRPLFAQHYAIFQVKYDPGSFYAFQPQILSNLVDGSNIVGASFKYSLGDHSDIEFIINLPTGGQFDEFSNVAAPALERGPLGSSQQGMVKYKAFF